MTTSPENGTFIEAAYLILTVLGLVMVLLGAVGRFWLRRRRRAERQRQAMTWQIPEDVEPSEPARPEAKPGGGIGRFVRATAWQTAAYFLALGLGTVAFLIYMAGNPLPHWLTQKAFEAEYQRQLDALESRARLVEAGPTWNQHHTLEEPIMLDHPEILEAELVMGNSGYVVYRKDGVDLTYRFTRADPIGPGGQMPTITIMDCKDSRRRDWKVVKYRRNVTNPAAQEIGSCLLVEYCGLRRRLKPTRQ